MKFRTLLILTIILTLSGSLFTATSNAQTPQQFKQHVKSLLKRIQDASCDYAKASGDDSITFSKLENANGDLSAYLMEILPKMPQSLTMKFHDERIWVTSSPDHKLRSWAWNTYTGGSMPQILEFVEYKTPSGIKVVDPYAEREGGNDSWISEIKAIRTVSGHTYYLAISGWVADGRHEGEQVDVYEIQGDTLNTQVPLFKTKKDVLAEISYHSEPRTARRNRFKFSADGRTFLVPLALYKTKTDKENDVVTMTSRSLRYDFDGNYYVYRGIGK